jgi:hypothetical protein
MNPTDTPQIAASQFPEVYENLGIDPNNLGCIMLNVDPIQVSGFILYDDVYQSDPTEHPHQQGIISEVEPHCTLLYGLLRPGLELKKHVDAVLSGWTPQSVTIAAIDVFPNSDPEQPLCLVAKLEPSANLLEANARLRLLPHIDTHTAYNPHVTLCYLNQSSNYQGYVRTLNSLYQGKIIGAQGINYGD